MTSFNGIETAGDALHGAIVTIGNFDGLHRGHRMLIQRARDLATQRHTKAAVLTFAPHPARLLAPAMAPAMICTPRQRQVLFEQSGADLLVEQPFDIAFASVTADAFTQLLLDRASVGGVVVGHDFTYGRARAGNVETLAKECADRGRLLEVVSPVTVDGLVASSSKVREFVLAGNVEGAAMLLGRPFAIEGLVVRGAGRGRTIGVPTANIAAVNELLPCVGVYAVRVRLPDGTLADGACNVGLNPTFRPDAEGGAQAPAVSVEVHLPGRSIDLYGAELSLSFVARLRAERRFPSVDALIAQIKADIAEAQRRLAETPVVAVP